MKAIFRIFILCTLSVVLASCAGKGKRDQYAGIDGDYVLGTPLPDRVAGANFFGDTVNRGEYPIIYFPFDSYSVTGEELSKVRNLASAMKGFSNDIIIAGFTDERGTEEYNRGLGELRAQSVRSALIELGVDGNRVQTVSFGKEMPADPASNESAWAKNRRAEVGVIR